MPKKDAKEDGRRDKVRLKHGEAPAPLRELLRVPGGGEVDLSWYEDAATPAGLAATAQMSEHLADLKERL